MKSPWAQWLLIGVVAAVAGACAGGYGALRAVEPRWRESDARISTLLDRVNLCLRDTNTVQLQMMQLEHHEPLTIPKPQDALP